MASSPSSPPSSSPSSSSSGNSPATTLGVLPDDSAVSASGLRLRLNTDDSSDGVISPTPSLLPLSSFGEIDSAPSSTTQSRNVSAATTPAVELATLPLEHKRNNRKGKKDKKNKLKSPLLEALKLPPLTQLSIPQPIQIKFAPGNIPPSRRLQMAAVAAWAVCMPFCVILFYLLLSYPITWPLLIPYCIWIMFDTAPEHGSRPRQWMRRSAMWKYFAQYYPCSIVKEADLPPDRTYVFGYHPHGIIGMGAVATFGTDATGFSDYFPGVKPHLLTLETNFRIPFYREIIMSMGISSVSRRSCRNILKQGPGSSITIVVGGAAESLYAHPGTNDLTLKRRFGFIKVAIREGASLVPVFSFGENDIYEQLANERGSTVYKLQKKFQNIFGFTLPLFHGRGVFNYNYGLLPYRHPIVSVIGKPIAVEKTSNPSDEYVQDIQKQYIDELVRIWDRYKDLYAKNRSRELTLIE